MKDKSSTIGFGNYLILLLLSFIWGSSFILIKKALIAFNPIELSALRVFLTFLAFLPIIIYHRKNIDWSLWKKFLAVGVLGSALPSILFAVAQTEVSSSIAGVLNSLTPVFTLIMAVLLFGQKVKRAQIIGVLFGFIGALFLLLGDQSNDTTANFLFGLLIIAATLCYAFNGNIIKSWFENTPAIIISSVSFSLLGPLAGIYLLSNQFIDHMASHEYAWKSLAAVAFLAVVATAISTILYFKLIQDTDAIFGSSVAFVIPIFAVMWGLFDGEGFYITQLFGMFAVLLGIYLIREKNKSA